jgi:hypothetical protein
LRENHAYFPGNVQTSPIVRRVDAYFAGHLFPAPLAGACDTQRAARAKTHVLARGCNRRLPHAVFHSRATAKRAARRRDARRIARELLLTHRAPMRKISQNHVAQIFGIRTTTH